MTAATKQLAFIIPVRDDAHRLRQCLRSIRSEPARAVVEIVVADNGSRDDSREVARAAGATVMHLPGLRVAALRNRAARDATTPLLAFVDADHTLHAGWLEAALAVLSDPQVSAAGAVYSPAPDATWVQRTYDLLRVRVPGQHRTDWLGSGNLVVRREVFTAIGGFDEQLETCEDVDFCNRLRLAGHRLVSDGRLGSTHHGDPATLLAVFLGELWRGRDNLKVTLRGPLSPRALLSLLIPVVHLVLLAGLLVGLGGLVVRPDLRWSLLPLLCAAGILALLALRATRMTAAPQSAGWRAFLPSVAVAAAYDAGRALALVGRASHRARRAGPGERAHV